MDDHLRLESLSAAALRTLLAQERAHRQELEQEVARLRAALARQNEAIIALERQNTELRREQQELRTLVAGLTEQNALLRRQAAVLHQENARLRGIPLAPAPDPTPEIKPATPKREGRKRKKRAPEHNAGRHRMERANRWMDHAAEQCPHCGEQLSGGWIQRRVQVIDLPPVAPLEITEHRILMRQCPRCGKRVLPPPPAQEAGRIGRCRFGPRLLAAIAVMATVERLPGRQIQERLRREYGLSVSHGGICGLLQRMAQAATPSYEQLQADVRASPVVYGDETGWRESGQHTFVWTFSTPQTIYVHHIASRAGHVVDAVLGEDFAGTLVTDFYAGYDHLLTTHQRCWRHLWRDLQDLLSAHAEDVETVAWVEGIGAIWKQATADRPAAELATTPQAARAREERARSYEQQVRALCPESLDPNLPHATLAKRLRRYGQELFTFVRDPRVDPTNNAAERSLRALVIARKVSGGTRSAVGSQTRTILYSVCATARMQGKNPATICQQLLLAPAGSPSPLAAPPRTT
jgi:transposase